jgi:hypothetical protein
LGCSCRRHWRQNFVFRKEVNRIVARANP